MFFCIPTSRKDTSLSAVFDDVCSEKVVVATPPPAVFEPRLPEHEAAERLRGLRNLVQENKLDYYVVPSGDEHQSEYTATSDQRRQWLTGFTGSAGTALVGRDGRALLFVDSRYWIQAAQQVTRDWEIIKLGDGKYDAWSEWILAEEQGSRVGIDPKLIAANAASSLSTAFAKQSSTLVALSRNLVDEIRTVPERSLGQLDEHPMNFSGRLTPDKLQSIRKTLFKGENAHASYVLPVLPAIAWLLNLRCQGDIAMNPVFFSYVVLTSDECVLFVDARKVGEQVKKRLESDGVCLEPYGLDKVIDWVKSYRSQSLNSKARVLAPKEISWSLVRELGQDVVEIIDCPVDAEKAIKNQVEMEGFRNAYLRDGLAYVRWMAWLQDRVNRGDKIREWAAGDKLREIRSHGKHFRGLAYDNIVGYAGNGALPHYAPVDGQDLVIGTDKPLVVDSGAQYLDGTIDTTRTLFLGDRPTKEYKRAYTRVLQGHIAFESTPFPEGRNHGWTQDALARQFLYQDGLDYGHGTGHGVGEYLSVHEGPHGVPSAMPLRSGELISNEPGFYKPNDFGIRIESVLICRPVHTKYDFGGKWLGWERITVVPLEPKLIEWSLLTTDQAQWVKVHQREVKEKLLPLLKENGDALARKWLKKL